MCSKPPLFEEIMIFAFAVLIFLADTVSAASGSAIEGLFNDHQRCPACLLFTTQLYVQMAMSQAHRDLDPNAAKKFLAREDRVSDVLEATIKSSVTEFAWVESGSSEGRSPSSEGRYWLIKNLRRRQLFSQEMEKAIARQIKSGGDSGFLNFMRMTIIGENEEEVEELVKKNDLDPRKGIQLLCVRRTKVCPAHVAEKISDLHPMDDEGAQWMMTEKASRPPPSPKPVDDL